MHKVLCIPELLDQIFSYSSQRTRTAAARTCRLWFAHSLRYMWAIIDLNDALRILSPFVNPDVNINGGFEQPKLALESWDRFFLYSRHVRQITSWCIEFPALRQAALWRPAGEFFFPKLTILQCGAAEEANVECLPLLLTPTLQILHIKLGRVTSPETLDILYKTIPIRSPLIYVFQLQYTAAYNLGKAVPRSLIQLLFRLRSLISLAIPVYYITPEILKILSRFDILKNISGCDLDFNLEGIIEMSKSIIRHSKEAGELPSFRYLKKLKICDGEHIDNNETFTLIKTLESGIQLHQLVELSYCIHHPNFEKIAISFETIPIIFPTLQKMTVYGPPKPYRSQLILPWEVLRTLLKCTTLVELTFSIFRIKMELEDIVAIATNRASWKVLDLPSSLPLSYHALIAFAQNCPNLVELGLTLDSELDFPDLSALSADIKFRSLTLLNLGSSLSAFTSQSNVARLLASICGSSLEIGDQGDVDIISAAESVKEMMSFITTMQLKNQRLETEIAEMKARGTDLS